MVRGIGRKTAGAAALGVLLALGTASPASANYIVYFDPDPVICDGWFYCYTVDPSTTTAATAAAAGGGGEVTLAASGDLLVKRNLDGLVTIDATAETVATCRNPATGEHRPPGQNPAPTTVTGSVSIPQLVIKNGRAPFTVTSQPVTVVPGAPDCPNANWIEEIVDLRFTAATLTAWEPSGVVADVVTCTISPPSSDGLIPAEDVSCTHV